MSDCVCVRNGYISPGDVGPDGRCCLSYCQACSDKPSKENKKTSYCNYMKFIYMILLLYILKTLYFY